MKSAPYVKLQRDGVSISHVAMLVDKPKNQNRNRENVSK